MVIRSVRKATYEGRLVIVIAGLLALLFMVLNGFSNVDAMTTCQKSHTFDVCHSNIYR